jgi:hypothetical protein
MRLSRPVVRLLFAVLTATSFSLALSVPGVSAQSLAPWWGVTSGSRPSSLPAPGGQGEVFVSAQNRGDAAADGSSSPVRIADVLPAGLEAIAIKGVAGQDAVNFNRGPVTCALKTLECTWSSESLPPFEQIEVRIRVRVKTGAHSGEANTASVSGGGAASAVSATHPLVVGAPRTFGFDDYQLVPEEAGGSLDTQAGSHPFQLTNVVTFTSGTPDAKGNPRGVALPKDVAAALPPGLIGNPTPFRQCTDAQFSKGFTAESGAIVDECPASAAVGVATVTFTEPKSLGFVTVTTPIFNMTPRVGEPARFAFKPTGLFPVYLDTSIRTGSDYGVTVTSSSITEFVSNLSAKLIFWGTPGDPRHDSQRGWECLKGFGTCPPSTGTTPPPFLAMPTSCGAPFQSTLRGDSWGSSEQPAEEAAPVTYSFPEAIDGCNRLPFSPQVKVTPDGTVASSPTGLNVDVHVPQDSILNSESLAESAVKNITVALPPGVAINPSGGDGLQACNEGQIGYLPPPASEPPGNLRFTSTLGADFCPDASKIGTVEIASPLLPPGQHVRGAVYLATQNENPFGSLIGLYIVAEDPISGVLVKLPGETELTDSGQIIGIFKNTPQLAFEDAELHFFGGERAPLATPARCGAYTTDATFAPWSGNEPVSSSSTFEITSGPGGSSCPGANLPFSPSLTGGSTNINAGAFTPLTTTIGRADGNQDMQAVTLRMPPGLSGILAGLKLCPEAQANEGSCGPESQIGETTVSAGVGSDPVSVRGGRVYITEKYRGAPFGLSIVDPVKAGPFDLERDTSKPAQNPPCDCVVVRAKIEVDQRTAELTITTDPSGAHAIPHLIDGIPVQIQKVNVLINRPGFTFNPTNCTAFSLTGSISSDEGASAPVAVPFQATNCATLSFKPSFKVTTTGKNSRAKGAGLHVNLAYPKAPFGSQANIRSVKVSLPKLLPSNLKTLQQACPHGTFETNPAGCGAGSIVGHATATTPLLPVALSGPAYFVSYGGAKFPELVVVLQGYGVTLDLHGETFINEHTNVTSSTFHTVPDAPVGTFELTLPQGRSSALAAPTALCGKKLIMPTSFTAQNGATIKQSTVIGITGCPKAKAKHKKKIKKKH